MNRATDAVSFGSSLTSRRAVSWTGDRIFYSFLTWTIALVTVAGFAHSFYFRRHFGTSANLTPLLVAHGTVMSMWTILLVAQSSLIAAHQTRLHRKVGMAGVVLALSITVMMMVVTFIRGRVRFAENRALGEFVFNVSMLSPAIFAILMVTAVRLRRRTEYHKRLVILAATELISAALARLPIVGASPLGFFAASDLFVLSLVVHDLAKQRSLHPATLWGGGLLILSQPIRVLIAGSPPMVALAARLLE
jgi:hypothetical protein